MALARMRPDRGALGALLLCLAVGLGGRPARAESASKLSQFHFRVGEVKGSFSGSVTGDFGVANSIDMDYEIFSASKRSTILRTIICQDLSAARLVYAYAGVGKRYYFKSSGAEWDNSEGGSRVYSVPKRRYYYGIDLGISQVVVKTFGPVLQASSAMFDLGGNLGIIQQLSKSVGLEAQAGVAYGIGFSSVSVSAITERLLVGVSYFF
jgi:hypothetical protein